MIMLEEETEEEGKKTNWTEIVTGSTGKSIRMLFLLTE